MKILRLVFAVFVLFFVAVFGIVFISASANTASSAPAGAKVTTVKGTDGSTASFYTDTVREHNDFGYGVYEENLWGYSTSSYGGYDVDGLTGITGTKVAGTYYSQNVNTIVVSPSAEVIITPWANVNNSKWTLTRVKDNIADFHEKNPGYTVVCAINGNAFDIGGTGYLQYQPSGPEVSFGNVYKTSWNYNSLVWGFKNNGTSDSVVTTIKSSFTFGDFILDILDANGKSIGSYPVASYNTTPGEGATSVWYGNYDSAHTYNTITMNGTGSVFVCSDETNNTVLENSDTDFYGLGMITSTVNKSLEEHEFAIETNNAELVSALSIGKTIRVQREITGDFASCDSIIGTFHRLYEDGTYKSGMGLDNSRAPRTFLGYCDDGTIVLSCADGRQGGKTVDAEKGWVGMYGMDGAEEAAVLKHYGCTNGMNLDGGGSSTVVIKDDSVEGGYRVTNYPSDGHERRDGNCILIAVKQPILSVELAGTTQKSAHLAVKVNDANGLDLTHMYLKLAGTDKLLELDENKEIEISRLDEYTRFKSNTTYDYTLYFGDKNNPSEVLKTESFTTLKIKPIYRGVTITDNGDDYTFTLNCDDPDSALLSAIVYFSPTKFFYLNDGTYTVSKSAVTPEEMDALYVKVSYQLASYEEMKSISAVADTLTAFKRLISKGDIIPNSILG